jgi:hypothetical protein
MNKININQTPSMRFTMKSTYLSITLASVLLGSLLATAGAAVTKTRFDLNRSQTFKQSRVDRKPRVTEALFERWVGVPPWHQEVIGLTIPGTTTVPGVTTVTGGDTGSGDDGTELNSGSDSTVIIPIIPITPQRSHSDEEEVLLTPNVYGNGWERVFNYSAHGNGGDPF